MRILTFLTTILLAGAAAAAVPAKIEVTPEIERNAEIAAQHLMDKLDVNRDGVADSSDAESVVAMGIGAAERLAIQGAMRLDQDGDGKITPEEVESAAKRVFDLLSDPATGKIPGRDETFAQYLEHDMVQFRMWDADRDGTVTRREVEAFVTSENPRRAEAVRSEYEGYLRTMDADRDGRITVREMKAAFVRAETYPRTPHIPAAEPSLGVGLEIARFAQMQASAILKEFEAGPSETLSHEQAILKGGKNCYLLSMDEEQDGRITRGKIERRARKAASVADVDKDGLLSQSEMIDAWTMLHGMKVWRLPDEAPGPGHAGTP